MNTAVEIATDQSTRYVADMIIRGRIIRSDLVEFGGRGGNGFSFLSPDPHKYVDQLPLGSPSKLRDLYGIAFTEILDYLEDLGSRLNLECNHHLQEALDGSYRTAPTTAPILKYIYRTVCKIFDRAVVTEMAEIAIGVKYLEGWVPTKLVDGRTVDIRAFGSRGVHIVAGNGPQVSALTIIRNAISRSDTIIKTPSNDPFTALAIVKTMCDMAPNHPLTRHISVAYWKGGDDFVEKQLYRPHNIEKIVAWGGLSSVKHVTKYIQPGLELISLDPKRSISIVGKEAFESEASMLEASERQALDVGTMNQNGCVNSRISYVESGTDERGLERARQFGKQVYAAMMRLPQHMSTTPKSIERELRSNIAAVGMQDDWYHVVGGGDEGAVIVSLLSEKVGFYTLLADRTLNVVPVDSVDDLLEECDAYTQTVGIYPESLKDQLRNLLPLHGAQRLVSLGYALTLNMALPQDSIEPLRRCCKWIVDEKSVPEVDSPYWPL